MIANATLTISSKNYSSWSLRCWLMITSPATLNADMLTSVVVLSAVGVALVTLIRRVERRLLRWAPEFRT